MRCLLCADQSCSGCQAKGRHSLRACAQERSAPALLPQHRLATVPCQALLSTAAREAPPFSLRITRTKKHTRKKIRQELTRISRTEIKSTPPAQLHACLPHQAKAKRMPRPGTCSQQQQNTPCPLTPPRLVQDQTKGKPKSHKNQHKLTQSKSPEGTRREWPPFPSNQRYKISNLHSKSLNLGEEKGRRRE